MLQRGRLMIDALFLHQRSLDIVLVWSWLCSYSSPFWLMCLLYKIVDRASLVTKKWRSILVAIFPICLARFNVNVPPAQRPLPPLLAERSVRTLCFAPLAATHTTAGHPTWRHYQGNIVGLCSWFGQATLYRVVYATCRQWYSSSQNHFSFSFYTVSEFFSVLVSIKFFRNNFSSVSVSVFTSFQ